MSIRTIFFLCGLGLTFGLEDKTIAQWLETNGFTTLVSALKSANLYDTLNSTTNPQPFTVFAPTDQAFQNVPNLSQITSDPRKLEAVLKYHVVQGYQISLLLTDGAQEATLNGQTLSISKTGTAIKVNTATVTRADVILKNGIVHVIDQVLVPNLSSLENIGEILLKDQSRLSNLNLLLTLTDLQHILFNNSQSLTLFAPTDAAFAAVSSQLPDLPAGLDTYRQVLLNHVVQGEYMAADLRDGQKLNTLAGNQVTVHLGQTTRINNAQVVSADLKGTNGVIHVINGVLI